MTIHDPPQAACGNGQAAGSVRDGGEFQLDTGERKAQRLFPAMAITASVTSMRLVLLRLLVPLKWLDDKRAGQVRAEHSEEEEFAFGTVVRTLALTDTSITWPPVGGGLTTGECAVYVSTDRDGNTREVWPGGCDNPGLEDPLREIVKKWKLKPAKDHGNPVQIESLVTFKFETKVLKGDPILVLNVADMAPDAFVQTQ